MEIAIVVFIGLWLCGASIAAYIRLKKEYWEVVERKNDEKDGKQ